MYRFHWITSLSLSAHLTCSPGSLKRKASTDTPVQIVWCVQLGSTALIPLPRVLGRSNQKPRSVGPLVRSRIAAVTLPVSRSFAATTAILPTGPRAAFRSREPGRILPDRKSSLKGSLVVSLVRIARPRCAGTPPTGPHARSGAAPPPTMHRIGPPRHRPDASRRRSRPAP